MTKHVTTCKGLVDGLGIETKADRVMLVVSDKPYWDYYNIHHTAIDSMLKRYYADFVLPDVSNLTEAKSDPNDPVFNELSALSSSTLDVLDTALSRLWELESVAFSPIENYDRYEDITDTSTGNYTTNRTNNGSITDTRRDEGNNETTTNGNESVTDTHSGGVNTTTENSDTTYNTNLVNTSNTNSVDSTKVVTANENSLATTYSINTTTTNTHIINGVTDDTANEHQDLNKHTAHIHGNIGVTTSTAMMNEFQEFYTTYSFWLKFWRMFINLNASCVFDTDRHCY